MNSGRRSDEFQDAGRDEAMVEARLRWGPLGAISIADQYLKARCLVGELRGGRFWIQGRGATWQAAFVDAEARSLGATRRHAEH